MRFAWVVTVVAGVCGLRAPLGAAGHDGTANVRVLELEGAVLEHPGPLSWLIDEEGRTLRSLTGRLLRVAEQDDVDGVLIRLKDVSLNASMVEELGQAIAAVKRGGKRVHVYAESYGPAEMRLASYADEVIVQEGGQVTLPGVYVEEMYLADMLAWAGVKADFVQVGDYKGASEPLARTGPSPEWDSNINSLLDALYGQMCEQIMAGRGMDRARLDAALAAAWLASGEQAIQAGLIDAEVDLPELTAHLEKSYGKSISWSEFGERSGGPKLDVANPFAMMAILMKEPRNKPRRETIAVIHIDGAIVDGESASGGLMGATTVGGRTIRKALQQIEDSDLIKGLVVRINSPGGSAVASEIIWQGVRRVAAKKPVYVSVGTMAASGGYYIAVAGDRVYVNPSSIVGSIGVVGGKLAMGGLMDNLKVRVVGRARGPMANMMSSTSAWTEAERGLVRSRMADTYRLFTMRVSQGRSGINLAETAEGRLFAGLDAVNLKMADEVGTFGDTIADLAGATGLREGTYDVMDYPGPKGLAEMMEEMMGGMMSARAGGVSGVGLGGDQAAALIAGVAHEVLGENAWSVIRDSAQMVLQMRSEPVMLASPRVLIFK